MNDFFLQSPIGKLKIETNINFVCKVKFINEIPSEIKIRKKYDISKKITQEIIEYFEYRRTSFTVPFKLNISEFYRKTLLQVCKIQFGETASYGQIAEKVGNPNASRAVGTANKKKPLP